MAADGRLERTDPALAPDDPSGARRRSQVAQRAAQEVRDALRPFTIPNGITLVRLALVPFFILAVVEGKYPVALAVFLAAGISDGLDGWLARSLGMRSLLGSYLDPIADKALLVSAFVVLTWPQLGVVRIPLWLTVLALSRDFLIVLTALVLYLATNVRAFPPSIWGKGTTVMHIITVGLVLVANIWKVPDPVLLGCFYLALGLTLLSGIDYIRRASLLMEHQPPTDQ